MLVQMLQLRHFLSFCDELSSFSFLSPFIVVFLSPLLFAYFCVASAWASAWTSVILTYLAENLCCVHV
jgi:hypothetical protein